MKRVRAGILGLGVGEQHVAGYEAHPLCEVVAICDIDAERLETVGGRHPGPRRTTDPSQVLTAADVDVVSVASYDDAHYQQVRLALEHNKHVFAEKPLCLHEYEAREIASLLRERPQLRLSSNVPLRMSPRFRELKERIARGELGELFHMEGDYDYGRRHKLTDGWRAELPYYSVVLGGAIHMVDLLLWLSGKRVVEVTHATATKIATAGTRFSHPDFVLATARFEDGSTLKVTANLGCVSPHFHGVRVYGTAGTFVNGLPDGALYHPAPSPEGASITPVRSAYPGIHKGDLLHSFVESILTDEPAAVTAAEVFDALAVCFAIERAMREGSPQQVMPPA